MKTTVRFDPNVRVRGNGTRAGFEDVGGSPELYVGKEVFVYEEESGISGAARITEISVEKRLIYLSVDWSALYIPDDEDNDHVVLERLNDALINQEDAIPLLSFPVVTRVGSATNHRRIREPRVSRAYRTLRDVEDGFVQSASDGRVLIAQ